MPTGFVIPPPLFGATGRATGFGTPASDTAPQVHHVLPRRVIPIVFLPGIMGTNLRITSVDRIRLLKRDAKSNIAWRPDNRLGSVLFAKAPAAERQLVLDPATTAVDVYDPNARDEDKGSDARNENVVLANGFDSPLLSDDAPGLPGRRTSAQKARARGWGEVYFGSYGALLQRIESRMHRLFSDGKLAPGWNSVVGVDPKTWGLDPSTPQAALTEAELRAITKGTFFPVHAVGYNWLLDNRVSADGVADAIRKIIDTYKGDLNEGSSTPRHDCPGVIVVTHSMGGLVGRALVHPNMGGAQDVVLGIVHGVQPAMGAAAGYTRIRAGFEDAGLGSSVQQVSDSIAAKVAGNHGDEVTAVLASSAGGLQLLPSKAYGNGWLRVQHNGHDLLQLPARGDPYEEIYKLRGKWYGLFPNEAWLNPAESLLRNQGNSLKRTHQLLDVARQFHDELADVYHEHTYVHYGADPAHRSFGSVTWQISPRALTKDWADWPVVADSRQGTLTFVQASVGLDPFAAEPTTYETAPAVTAKLDPPDEAGDQTVPMRSADRQLRHGRCKAVFRQTGYDHQGSYQNEAVIAATLFSILRIAQRVQLP